MSKTVHKFKIADFDQFLQKEDHMIRGVGNLPYRQYGVLGNSPYYCYKDSATPRIIDSGS